MRRPTDGPGGRAITATVAEGAAARGAAVGLLSGVLDEKRPLDALIDSAGGLPEFRTLLPRDRALARAIAGVALRRHGQIADILARLIARRPPPRAGRLMRIIEVAAAQMLFLDVPDHAAVSIAVDQAARDPNARHFKALVNGVLRRLAREREALLAGQDAVVLNTPGWLFQRWSAHYGAGTARAIAEAHLTEAALDVTVRREATLWAERLGGTVLPNGSVRFLAKGPIESLPGFADGAWWVQDAAATLPVRLLGDVSGQSVADLCAAPGGKTMQLAAAGAQVTAVDRSLPRLGRLRQNLVRLRLEAETVAADVLGFDGGRRFDAVLLDAPCSATGTIRRHPDVAWLKSAADIATLAALQAQLLARAVELARPGGLIIYSTCSLEPEEGEDQARRALVALPVAPAPISPEELAGLGTISREGWACTLPSDLPAADRRLAGLSGFFIARFRRK